MSAGRPPRDYGRDALSPLHRHYKEDSKPSSDLVHVQVTARADGVELAVYRSSYTFGAPIHFARIRLTPLEAIRFVADFNEALRVSEGLRNGNKAP